jgi:regulator of replication initiation timing
MFDPQSTTLDKERQYYTDAEALMQSQKVNIQSQLDKLAKQNAQLHRENERMVNKLAKVQPLQDPQKGDAAAAVTTGRKGAGVVPEGQIEIATGDDEDDDEMTTLDRAMSSIGPTRSTSARSLQEEAETEQLRTELQTIQRSHGSLQATMQRLQMELKEVKNQNRELRDQNETFQGVLEERTFSGSLLKNSALLRGAGRAVGASDADSTADDDGSDDEDATTETDDTSVSVDDVDDVEDEPTTPSTKASDRKKRRQQGGVAVKRGRDGRQEISTGGGITAALPTDLASELEHAQDDEEEQDGNADVAKQRRMERRRKRSGTLSNDVKGESVRIAFVFRKSLNHFLASQSYKTKSRIYGTQTRA